MFRSCSVPATDTQPSRAQNADYARSARTGSVPLTLLYLNRLESMRAAARRLYATFSGLARHSGDAIARGYPAQTPETVEVRAMPRGSKNRMKQGMLAVGGLLAFGAFSLAPAPAAAQGLFGTLFGGLDNPARYRDERLPVRSYAPSDYERGYGRDNDRFFPPFSGRSEQREARPAAPAHGGTVHCVRLCDGRYFPVPRSAGGVRLDPAKVCSALCPAAETKVFHGGDMQYARASDGTRYASLDTAFTFRDRLVPDCSCTGRGPGGLAQIDIESDPTLRAGDIVATTDGLAVFNGARQFPYRTADFTPVEDYGRLHRNLREKLADLQVNTQVEPVVPPQRIDVAQPERPARSARTARTSDDAEPRRPVRRAQPQRQYEPRQAEPRYQRPQRSAHQAFPMFRLW
jgi:hypothetical protein